MYRSLDEIEDANGRNDPRDASLPKILTGRKIGEAFGSASSLNPLAETLQATSTTPAASAAIIER
jgi:hypothetical protein